MPARFLKTAYEPPHNGLAEMRKRGLPWLAASSILIILVLVASVSYLFLRDQQRGSSLVQTPFFTSFFGPKANLSIADDQSVSAEVAAVAVEGSSTTRSPNIETTFTTSNRSQEPSDSIEISNVSLGDSVDDESGESMSSAVDNSFSPAAEEPTSAVPWTEDHSTESEEATEATLGINEEKKEEEFIDTALAVPVSSVREESSSEETEPMRGDYPDAFYLTSSTPLPSEPSRAVAEPRSDRPKLPVIEFSRAAITATNEICADIARNVLMAGGNAVDAAIAGAFCLGGVEPQAGGLGGGLVMTVYQKETGRCEVVNGRERAPSRIDEEEWERNPRKREIGYTSVAVPGALHALISVYRRLRSSRVEWAGLVQPTIELVESGFPASAALAYAVSYRAAEINETAGMREIFLPSGVPLREGEIVRDVRLADTLRRLAASKDPAHLFYRGELAERIVHEIKSSGGFISKSDLVLFSSSIEDALTVPLGRTESESTLLCGPAPPSSFAALQAGLRIIKAMNVSSSSSEGEEIFSHYLLEATKKAIELRQQLGDGDSSNELVGNLTLSAFIEETAAEIGESAARRDKLSVPPLVDDVASAHLNVIDEQGNAVAVTMGLNRPFGALRRSESLGLVWNNALSAFAPSTSRSPNALQGKKRPMTAAMPFVLLNPETKEASVVGGVTGEASSALSALLSILARLLIRSEPVEAAVAAPRIDAASGAFEAEALVQVRALAVRGHALVPLLGRGGAAATHLVARRGHRILAVCDPRARLTRCARGI